MSNREIVLISFSGLLLQLLRSFFVKDRRLIAIVPHTLGRVLCPLLSRLPAIDSKYSFLSNDANSLTLEYGMAGEICGRFEANLQKGSYRISSDYPNDQVVKAFEATWSDAVRWSLSLVHKLRADSQKMPVYLYMPHSVDKLYVGEWGQRLYSIGFRILNLALSPILAPMIAGRRVKRELRKLSPAKPKSSGRGTVLPLKKKMVVSLIDSDTDLNFEAAKNLIKELSKEQSIVLLPFGCSDRKLAMLREIAPDLIFEEFKTPRRPTRSKCRVAQYLLQNLEQALKGLSAVESQIVSKYCTSTAYFIANFLEQEVLFIRNNFQKHENTAAGLMIPDAHPVNKFLCLLFQGRNIPTFTIDTCMLAGFDTAGKMVCDYTFVSGSWNKRIYERHGLSANKKVIVTGAPRYENIPYRQPTVFKKNLIYCTENSGLERTLGIIRELSRLSSIDRIDVWPHPAESWDAIVAEIGTINAAIGYEKLCLIPRNARDWLNCHGSVALVEHSTIGIEMSLRGCFLVSYNPSATRTNPYANTKTVPVLPRISEIDALLEGMINDEKGVLRRLGDQMTEVSDLFNKNHANKRPSAIIAQWIASVQANGCYENEHEFVV